MHFESSEVAPAWYLLYPSDLCFSSRLLQNAGNSSGSQTLGHLGEEGAHVPPKGKELSVPMVGSKTVFFILA